MPANLCNVSTRATKKPRQSIDPRPGRRIAARRTFLGKTLDDIEEETAGVVYRNLLSRIENGHKAADTMRANQVNALLPALQWTHADWIEALDLSPQNEADTQGTAVVQPHITPHGSREIPVIDMLSAGLGGEGGTIVDHVAIPDEWRGQFAAYRVSGDSMAPHIPDGATVIIKQQSHADIRQLVVCYAPGHGTVVKVLSGVLEDGTSVLTSLNPNYAPIVTSGVTIFGVVHKIWNDPPVIDGNGQPKLPKLN